MSSTFSFGRFELCPASRQLLRDGRPVTLGARAFDVLEALIERRERLVTKGELLELVWSGLVVEENNLQVQISTLRKLLGARAIATVPGRGYRFAFGPASSGNGLSRDHGVHEHNLPTQSTSLIGREHATIEIRTALGIVRLLTVAGVGGIGKTRLALEVAAEVLDDFDDGVWFVELAPLTDPGLVPKTIATALGIAENAHVSIGDTLIRQLAEKRTLLVLDNCEHLVDAAARLCQSLLAACPNVRILATSREALRVPGEAVYRVPPLPTADPTTISGIEELAHYPATQLFVDRAQAVRASFHVNANAQAIASICRHLDGIPLAIELAAARMKSLSVEEVNERLDRRFRFLTSGARTAAPRQQTLRALVDWSYELLTATEQKLFRRLAVFAGGCMLDSAEQVCAGDGIEPGDVLDVLGSLVDKNLVVADECGAKTRYRMLETVREYATEQLRECGEASPVRLRHFVCFLEFAEQALPHTYDAQQQQSLERLEREHDNLRAALAWSVSPEGDAADGLRLAAALGRFWWIRSYLHEGRGWISTLLAKVPAEQVSDARARVERCAGVLAWAQGDFAAARVSEEEGLRIARQLGDRSAIANSLLGLGQWIYAQDQADRTTARALIEESLAICREMADRRGIAVALNGLGNITSIHEHDYPASRALYEEALPIFADLGDRHGEAYALTGLGNAALDGGDPATARKRHEEGLAIGRDLGDRRGIVESLEGLAGVALAAAQVDRAARLWGAAERLREEIGHARTPATQSRHALRLSATRAACADDARFERAWQEGRAMTLDGALDYALVDAEQARSQGPVHTCSPRRPS